MKSTPYHLFSNYTLSVIPLFILMGSLPSDPGLSTQLFRAPPPDLLGTVAEGGDRTGRRLHRLWRDLRVCGRDHGDLCAAALPNSGGPAGPGLRGSDDRGRRHAWHFDSTVCALLVIYAILAQQNIAKLFMAALIPGLMASMSYCIVISGS